MDDRRRLCSLTVHRPSSMVKPRLLPVTQTEKLRLPSEDQYLNCIRCGLCLAVCPTYREHLSETASPRGRVALAHKGLEGELELSPNLAEQMYAEEFALALELGGTLSGEHGVGTLKRLYMEQALGPVSLEIQKRIKAALDPLNILNPGKVFPE